MLNQSMDNTLRFIVGLFGNVTALFLYLSPVVTFRRIIRNKSTEEFSSVPYALALLSNLLFAWYGLPFVSPKNLLVTTISGTGAIIELIYVVIFLIYAHKKEKLKLCVILAFVFSVFFSIVLVSLLELHGKSRKLLCGLVAALCCIMMYGAPLSVMKLVIKTKSVEYMPFLLSFCVFLCSTSWFIYGLLGADPFLFVPNGLGCAMGLMQLVLYAIYCKRNPHTEDNHRFVMAKPEKTEQNKYSNSDGPDNSQLV